MKYKVLVIFGTRPEAIKMAPLVLELQNQESIECKVCVSAQHRQMLDSVLEIFNIVPDFDLNIMKDNQTIKDITINALDGLDSVIKSYEPNLVLVHGDTTTTFVGSLAAFYNQVDVGHVEAGLRTHNIYSPFPEEVNRQLTGIIAKYHFTPTISSQENLLKEAKDPSRIYITGNTAIDALKTTIQKDYHHPLFDWVGNDRLIVLTAHRRENLGEKMRGFFEAISDIITKYDDIKVVFPVHLNPKVQNLAKEVFQDNIRVKLIDPMNVIDFHNILNKSYLILTDSGGIQEEAPSMGKPVIVLRDTTERPEGVAAGTLVLAGTEKADIYRIIDELLSNQEMYNKMSLTANPYGDGFACQRIVEIIKNDNNLK